MLPTLYSARHKRPLPHSYLCGVSIFPAVDVDLGWEIELGIFAPTDDGANIHAPAGRQLAAADELPFWFGHSAPAKVMDRREH
jgi:hypothetical protein